jgi:hypothetical protein
MRTSIRTATRSGVAAATATLLLVACGDGDQGPTGPLPVVLTVISGDNQPGNAGRHLGVRGPGERGHRDAYNPLTASAGVGVGAAPLC